MKRILLIRTYKLLGAGGPVPPLGLLSISSAIRKAYGGQYEIRVLDTGLGNFSLERLGTCLKQFKPELIGLSALSCEADLMENIASFSKSISQGCKIIAGGPHPTVAANSVLADKNIDIAVIGEGENSIVELLRALEKSSPLLYVKGIAFRENDKIFNTGPREYVENLDDLPFPAWDLIDLKEYSKFSNWNGIPKRPLYLPILTSRGCPHKCIYCHNIFGKTVRMRSPENVFEEIKYLVKQYNIKEFHIIDDIFNYDIKRAKHLCSLIISSHLKISLAFPNGLRADNIDEELISLLRKSGTYKINFGFESAVPRIQLMLKKNLNINLASAVVKKVSKTGIIAGGYFMLGLPTEKREDILKTIVFAAQSDLDTAYFFKPTPYPGSEFYNNVLRSEPNKLPDNFNTLHFYSSERSYCEVSPSELNDLILFAQQKFYLNSKRLLKGLLKSANKRLFFLHVLNAIGLILQSFILRKLNKNIRMS